MDPRHSDILYLCPHAALCGFLPHSGAVLEGGRRTGIQTGRRIIYKLMFSTFADPRRTREITGGAKVHSAAVAEGLFRVRRSSWHTPLRPFFPVRGSVGARGSSTIEIAILDGARH